MMDADKRAEYKRFAQTRQRGLIEANELKDEFAPMVELIKDPETRDMGIDAVANILERMRLRLHTALEELYKSQIEVVAAREIVAEAGLNLNRIEERVKSIHNEIFNVLR